MRQHLPRVTARHGCVWINGIMNEPVHARSVADKLAELCECCNPGEPVDLADAIANLDSTPLGFVDALQFANSLFQMASVAVAQEHADRLGLGTQAEPVVVRIAE